LDQNFTDQLDQIDRDLLAMNDLKNLSMNNSYIAAQRQYIPSPNTLTAELEQHFLATEQSSSLSSSPSTPQNRMVSRLRQLWTTVIESIAGLKMCRKLDVWEHKSVHKLSQAINYFKQKEASSSLFIPSCVKRSLQVAIEDDGDFVFSNMFKLFDKQRPQIVAMWQNEAATDNRFEKVAFFPYVNFNK
jgi:hypothetical protein